MKTMADGDMPLVTSYGGSDIEFNTNGTKTTKNSRMSNLIFWDKKGKSNGAPNGRNWIHDPNALVKGHVAYLVKFLGCTQVDQPKGIEVVKDAIKKLQFAKQLKKSEAKDSAKCKKVEITISVDGVAIQEPRSNNIMYQFPLHRISYCADDKGAKKFFSFIAKGGSTVNGVNGHHDGPITEKHECFVFISTKLASEITLTIGQAFDLAYRRFLNDNGKYIEMQKLSLQNRKLELQMNTYKTRLLELSKITYKDDLTAYLARHNLTDIAEFKPPAELANQLSTLTLSNGDSRNGQTETGGDATSNNSNDTFNSSNNVDIDLLMHSTPTPTHIGKVNGHGYTQFSKDAVFDASDDDSDFDPRAPEPAPRYSVPAEVVVSPIQKLLPPPVSKTSKRQPVQAVPPMQIVQPSVPESDPFSSNLFTKPAPVTQVTQTSRPNYDIADFNLPTSVFNSATPANGAYDPFDTQKSGNIFGNGYGSSFNGFGNLSENQTVALGRNSFDGFLEDTITEMKDGFSRGITFGNDEDFSIDNLDPLKKH